MINAQTQNTLRTIQKSNPVTVNGVIDKKTQDVYIIKFGEKDAITYMRYNPDVHWFFTTYPALNEKYTKPPSADNIMATLIRCVAANTLLTEIIIDHTNIYIYRPKKEIFKELYKHLTSYSNKRQTLILTYGLLDDSMREIVDKTQNYLSYDTGRLEERYRRSELPVEMTIM